jgi:hypothetical protein
MTVGRLGRWIGSVILTIAFAAMSLAVDHPNFAHGATAVECSTRIASDAFRAFASPDGRRVLTTAYPAEATFVDSVTGVSSVHTNAFVMHATPELSTAVVQDLGVNYKIDLATWQRLRTIGPPNGVFSSNERFSAVVIADQIAVLDIDTGVEVRTTVSLPSQGIVAISNDGRRMVGLFGGSQVTTGFLALVDLVSGAVVARLEGTGLPATLVWASPALDELVFYSALPTEDRRPVYRWTVATGSVQFTEISSTSVFVGGSKRYVNRYLADEIATFDTFTGMYQSTGGRPLAIASDASFVVVVQTDGSVVRRRLGPVRLDDDSGLQARRQVAESSTVRYRLRGRIDRPIASVNIGGRLATLRVTKAAVAGELDEIDILADVGASSEYPNAYLGVVLIEPDGCATPVFTTELLSDHRPVTPPVLHPGEQRSIFFGSIRGSTYMPVDPGEGITVVPEGDAAPFGRFQSVNVSAAPSARRGFRDAFVDIERPASLVATTKVRDYLLVRPWEGEFVGTAPTRVVDTRSGLGGRRSIGPGETATFNLAGQGGLPPSGVGAVVANVTATRPTATSYLTIFPTGQSRPTASNLNFVVGDDVPNLAVAALGEGGSVSVYNAAGRVDLLIDVVGYFASTEHHTPAGAFFSIVPTRALDTRSDFDTPLGSREYARLRVAKPGSPARSVALNVTVAAPTAASFLAVANVPTLATSNLNFKAGQTIANMVVAPIDSQGYVYLTNAVGNVHVIVDVLGYFDDGTVPVDSGLFASIVPVRTLDTRSEARIKAGTSRELDLSAFTSTNVDAVALNITATQSSDAGYLTVWPASEERPTASSVNFSAGSTVPNMAVTPLDDRGRVAIYAGESDVHVIVDLLGSFTGSSTSETALHRASLPARFVESCVPDDWVTTRSFV